MQHRGLLLSALSDPAATARTTIAWNSHQPGYLPRLDIAAVSQLLDRGQQRATN